MLMKLKQFQDYLRKKRIGFALFLSRDANSIYFSGFKGISVIKKNSAFLIVSKMELEQAKKFSRFKVVAVDGNFFKFIKRFRTKRIGVNKNYISVKEFALLKKEFKNSQFLDLAKECAQLRHIKNDEEIQIIKKACGISDSIMKNCISNFHKFKKETDVAAYLESESRRLGYDCSFPAIVASGSNSAQPHHLAKPEKLRRGFCIIDFGIKYKNYCTDTTRTIYIGKPAKKDIEMYNKIVDLQENVIDKTEINMKCSDLDLVARKELKNKFKHGLGHGVGINIHETPSITKESKERLKENMVFTIEPGIYFKKHGIRIEDMILLKNRPVVLTKITKELIII